MGLSIIAVILGVIILAAVQFWFITDAMSPTICGTWLVFALMLFIWAGTCGEVQETVYVITIMFLVLSVLILTHKLSVFIAKSKEAWVQISLLNHENEMISERLKQLEMRECEKQNETDAVCH